MMLEAHVFGPKGLQKYFPADKFLGYVPHFVHFAKQIFYVMAA